MADTRELPKMPPRVGPIVAERYKKQYFNRGVWQTFQSWHIQPEQNYLILRELESKAAVNALLGNTSWTKRIPKSLPTRAGTEGEK